MNFELSVAEIWLVLFDIVGLMVLIQKKRLFKDCRKWWKWVLFPVWVTISVIWSLNVTRGVLTVGLMWLIVMAIYTVWSLRDMLDGEFKRNWWKWFFGSTLVVCAWCVVQCVMDLAGVPQSCTLLCNGCTYRMFGFPHPNGFAIEPQFMGNLLLAPLIAIAYLYVSKKGNSKNLERERSRGSSVNDDAKQNSKNLERKHSRGVVFTTAKSDSARYCSTGSSSVAVVKTTTGSCFLCSKFLLFCFFVIAFTLFLTFSRGAIYAGVVGMCFLSGYVVARAGKKQRGKMWKRVGVVWLMVVGAFVGALNVQGLMAQVSPTSDTYMSGVAKVVNHLSLGVIDFRAGEGNSEPQGEPVEKPVENLEGTGEAKSEVAEEEISAEGDVVMEGEVTRERAGVDGEAVDEVEGEEKLEAVFDGYVAESTDTRMRLTNAAVKIWAGDAKTMLVGVGLGGAGQALYNNDLSPAPKEIVQNEYASLLLETGLVGVMLFLTLIIMAVRRVLKMKQGSGMILGLVVAYGVSLLFFSGLPNALQIYLMPVVLMVMM